MIGLKSTRHMLPVFCWKPGRRAQGVILGLSVSLVLVTPLPSPIYLQSPTFLAPGTGFVEDTFSLDWGGGGDGLGTIQVHYMYCALYFYYYYTVIYNEIIIQLTIMLTGGGTQAVMRAMGSGCKCRWSFAHSPAAHLLLRSGVPRSPRTDSGLWPGSWGPLLHTVPPS